MTTFLLALLVLAATNSQASAGKAGETAPTAVIISSSTDGISLDDFYFDRKLGRVVVPDGAYLNAIDPATRKADVWGSFPTQKDEKGRIGGVTSADGGEGLVFTTDRSDRILYAVDPATSQVVGSVSLSTGPDYVRYVAQNREVWVTEPRAHQIQIFSISGQSPVLHLASNATISIPDDGPEALVIDVLRGKAYTNSGQSTVVIDLKTRQIVGRLKNGCSDSEGLLLIEADGLLVAACREGKAVVLDLNENGRIVSKLKSGAGIDIMAYSPELGHLYLPGSKSATMDFASVSRRGKLKLLGTAPTAQGAHCAAADNVGGIWVCDPKGARLLYFKDPYPQSRR